MRSLSGKMHGPRRRRRSGLAFHRSHGYEADPAVVVQADFLNGLIDDTIFVKVQSNSFGIPGTEVRIDPAIEKASSLVKVCYVSCRDLLTRDQALILLGWISDGRDHEADRGLSEDGARYSMKN